MNPFVSVIVPTLGRASLTFCLQALSQQTYPRGRWEVIVVEDGTSSAARELTAAYRFRYVWQPHRGPAAARNAGVKLAGGEVVAFTDDDCTVPADWLEKLAEGYGRYPAVAGVGGYMEAPAEVLLRNPYAQYESYMTRQVYKAFDQEILGGFEVPTGGTNNISYRKEIFTSFGGFDENFPAAAGEDADFKMRVCQAGYRLFYLPLKVTHNHSYSFGSFVRQNRDRGLGSLYFHRKHGGGLSRSGLCLGFFSSFLDFLGAGLAAKISWSAAGLRSLATIINYLTQLKYYGKT